MKKLVSTSAVLCAILVSVSSFALATAATPPVASDSVIPPLLMPLFGMFLTALAGAGTWLAVKATGYVKTKTDLVQNTALHNALDVVFGAVFTKVAELNQTVIDKLKLAASDGKLSKAEAGAALTTAVAEVWASLPAYLKALLLKSYGTEEAVKTQVIAPRVEQAVKHQNGGRETLSTGARAIPALPAKPTVKEIVEARKRLGLVTTN